MARPRLLLALAALLALALIGLAALNLSPGHHAARPAVARPTLPPPPHTAHRRAASHAKLTPHELTPPALTLTAPKRTRHPGRPRLGNWTNASFASPTVAEVFTTTTGTWTNNPTGYAYQWEDCDGSGLNCVLISGAASSTYTLQSSDIGHTIRSVITASNPFGFNTQASAQSGVVASAGGAKPSNTVAPVLSGTTTQGQVLSVTNGTWTNTPTSYTYQWQDCDATPSCTNIPGATAGTYTLAASDVNLSLRAVVTAVNASGSGSAFSNISAAVTGATPSTGGGTWNGTQETGLSTTVCDKYAATTGNDSTGTGAIGAPYATPSKLASVLTAGQVGCLRAGTYSVGTWTDSTASETITAYPGEAVVLDGAIVLSAASIDLSYLNISLSTLVSTTGCPGQTQGAKPITVDGNSDTVEHNNIYDSAALGPLQRYNGIDVGFGPTSPTQQTGATIRDNRIHDYGAGCSTDVGVYTEGASGTINDNWIYSDNGSGGAIQFLDATSGNARQPHGNHAYANVADQVGMGFFMWEEGTGYVNNTTDHNVITNTSYLAGFSSNDAASSNTFTTSDGFTLNTGWPCDGNSGCGSIATSGNLTVDPQYNAASGHDYRVNNSSLSTWGLWDGDYGNGGGGGGPGPPPSFGGTWNGTAETGASTTTCDYYVSTSGNDSNSGTAADSAHAWHTVDHLGTTSFKGHGALPDGKTACIESGDYTLNNGSPGTLGTAIEFNSTNATITAAPGAVVTIHGWGIFNDTGAGSGMYLTYINWDEDFEAFANGTGEADCSNTTAASLGLEVDGDNSVIEHDNIYETLSIPVQNRSEGIGIGWNPSPTTHTTTNVTVAYSRIHDWGNSCGHGHGLYVADASNSKFYDNSFWGNPTGGAGIQFYDSHASPYVGPHDDQAYSNVFDNMRLGIFLFGETSSYANISINHNIFRTITTSGGFVANSGIVNNSISFANNDGTAVTGGWPCGSGNCGSPFAVNTTGDISSDPGFIDASSATTHDYRVSASSPEASWGMWDGDVGTSGSYVGNPVVGASAAWLDANYKRANCFTANSTGTVSRLSAYLSPTGNVGTQKIEGAIYAASGGVPGNLLSTTTELSFPSTDTAGWYDMPLQTPVAVTSGSTYCLGLFTGLTTQVAAVQVATSAGTLYYNPNTYATSGPSSPFGTASTGSQTLSLYATIQ